jgi:4'-phosphopantetheinyl transferase
MPLVFSKKFSNDVNIGLWQIDESTEFFESNLVLYNEEVNEIAELSERKQREWLSSRYLLQSIMNIDYRLAVIKNDNGKPYLIGTNHHISLSHSANFIAAIVAPFAIGIDVQYITEKIDRIKHKFLSEKEYQHYSEYQNLLMLHIYWGAKESLFKVYGLGSVDFKKHLYIEPFSIHDGCFFGNILKDNSVMRYKMEFVISDAFVLVYTVELVNNNF